ncbi:MAG: hypothetical protein N2C12_17290, partial [Planctomycetales bacterium]
SSGLPVLRFYRWEPATLSLGYFQRYVDRNFHAASLPCPVVRRSTGGGAILHDRELTYSMVWPQRPVDQGVRTMTAHWFYETVHTALQQALADFSVVAVFARDLSTAANDTEFLCFQRRSPWDLLVGPSKVAGSAQRRHRNALLQHGSVLLESSPFAPELPGLAEVAGQVVGADDLTQAWAGYLASQQKLALEPSPLKDGEKLLIRGALRNKYDCLEWTQRR